MKVRCSVTFFANEKQHRRNLLWTGFLLTLYSQTRKTCCFLISFEARDFPGEFSLL